MSTRARDPFRDPEARHRAAVANSLSWADDAAERADYAGALGWIQTVETVDGSLPEEYETKRHAWVLALNDADGGARSGRIGSGG